MWKLIYQECNITKRNRRIFFSKKRLISKMISLKEAHFDLIETFPILGSKPIENTIIYYVRCRECNITSWHIKYFVCKRKADEYIRVLKSCYWDDIDPLREISVKEMLQSF